MAFFPIDVKYSRLIVLGHVFGLVDETVATVAFLSSKSLFKVRSVLHSSSLQE
jgi:HrpA-like RNA helicase